MSEILSGVAKLIKVKTLVTLAVMAVFGILAIRGDIAPDGVKDIVYIVIAFYFGTQHERADSVR